MQAVVGQPRILENTGIGMIQNLVTSGCSFTAGNSWPNVIQKITNIPNLFNLGSPGSGNRYIANSVIDTIQYNKLTPENTLVLVMWSGPGRLDERICGEYWYLLDDYFYKANLTHGEDGYWVHSGGRSGCWLDHRETTKLFQQKYIVSDPISLCKETLAYMLFLENFLQNHKFNYRFMSYLNYWSHDRESVLPNGDFSLTYFCEQLPAYQAINFDQWIFVNDRKDSLYEFCFENQWLGDDNYHPNLIGHREFVQKIILPHLDLTRKII